MTLNDVYGRLVVSTAGAAIIDNLQISFYSYGGAATYMFILNILITFM